jgi:hypothetical protein
MEIQDPTKLTSAVYRVTELFPQNEPLRYKTREIADEILADFVLFEDLEKQNTETEQGFLRRNRVKNQIFSKIRILNDYYFDLAREQGWVHPSNFLILKREYGKMKKDIKTQFAQIEIRESAFAPEGLRRGKPKPELKTEGVPPPPEALAGQSPSPAGFEVEQEQPKIEPIEAELETEPEIPTISDKPSVVIDEPVSAPSALRRDKPSSAKGFGKAKKKLSARHKEILKIIEQSGKKQVGEIRESFPSLSKRTLRRDLEFLLKQGYVDRVGQWNEVSYRVRT